MMLGQSGQRIPEKLWWIGRKSEALGVEADESGGNCVKRRVRWAKIPGLCEQEWGYTIKCLYCRVQKNMQM